MSLKEQIFPLPPANTVSATSNPPYNERSLPLSRWGPRWFAEARFPRPSPLPGAVADMVWCIPPCGATIDSLDPRPPGGSSASHLHAGHNRFIAQWANNRDIVQMPCHATPRHIANGGGTTIKLTFTITSSLSGYPRGSRWIHPIQLQPDESQSSLDFRWCSSHRT